jgi:hypothetical protein
MTRFIGLFVALALGLYLILPVVAPDAAKDFRNVWQILSGQCAPDLLAQTPPVFVMDEKGCGPSDKLAPAPKIAASDLAKADILALTMANPAAMGDGRLVRLQWQTTLAALLDADATVPAAEEDRLKLAEDSLAQTAQDLCAMLPKDFAATCRLHTAKLDVDAARQDQLVTMAVELTFVPVVPVGALPTDNPPLGLYSQTIPLDGGADMATSLQAATARAEEACATIRAEKGNCMIAELTVNGAAPGAAVLVWISPQAAD